MFTGTPKTLQFRDVTDGTSNTIFVVDVDDDHAVIWTKPEDFTPDAKKPADGLANRDGNGFVMLWVDGSVHPIPANIETKTLYALFTRDGGENVSPP